MREPWGAPGSPDGVGGGRSVSLGGGAGVRVGVRVWGAPCDGVSSLEVERGIGTRCTWLQVCRWRPRGPEEGSAWPPLPHTLLGPPGFGDDVPTWPLRMPSHPGTGSLVTQLCPGVRGGYMAACWARGGSCGRLGSPESRTGSLPLASRPSLRSSELCLSPPRDPPCGFLFTQ